MPVREASRLAYQTVKYDPGICLRTRIHGWVWRAGPVSRRQIAESLNIETSCVAARVNELMTADKLREEPELSECPITGRRVHKVFVPDGFEPLDSLENKPS